jgi:hypothetical protein
MINHLLATLLFSLFTMAMSLRTVQRHEESRIISHGKGIRVSKLDNRLPRQRFDWWLQQVVGLKAKLHWEANDCGEQTGAAGGDANRDIPTCVEVEARLSSGSRLVVTIVVGSVQTGITKNPTLKNAFIENHGDFHTVKRLSDLSEIIRHGQNR